MDLWYSLCKNNKATYKEGPAIQKKLCVLRGGSLEFVKNGFPGEKQQLTVD